MHNTWVSFRYFISESIHLNLAIFGHWAFRKRQFCSLRICTYSVWLEKPVNYGAFGEVYDLEPYENCEVIVCFQNINKHVKMSKRQHTMKFKCLY